MSHINFELLDRLLPTARAQFQSAQPFEHLVIDGFLADASFRAMVESVPAPREDQKSSDYVFARNKFENPRFDESHTLFRELREELTSARFAAFLTALYGKPVFVDEYFVGGGVHQGGPGSFLNMHADFSRHPTQRDWVRDLNILLYMNSPYDEAWGGHLELKNSGTGQTGRIAPVGNRLVVMLTKAHTLHGYEPISFPSGRFRTSIAAYAYSRDLDFEATPDRSTLWRPQNDGLFKAALARVMPLLVKIKRTVFGSSTARRARRDR